MLVKMCLQELFFGLGSQENQGRMEALEDVLSFCVSGQGKVLGKPARDAIIGYRAPRICVKDTEVEKRENAKNDLASP